MPVGATIGAVGTLGAAGVGAWSAKTASDAQAAAAQQALAFQKQVYATNQTNLNPYITNGSNAMYTLAGLYGLPTPNNPNGGAAGVNAGFDAFTKLPAYQFPLQQGNLALERQLNAQGRQQSGAQVRATEQFGQGLASQYMMSNYVNPLMTISGQGLTAAGNLAGNNIQSGAQIGQSLGNIGTAQASGALGVGSALGGGLVGGANNLAIYSALANNGGLPGGSSTYGLSFNSPGSPISGALGPTSYGGIGGPQPFNSVGASGTPGISGVY